MDLQLQTDIPAHELPEEWQTILTEQVCVLEAMLTRITETVTAVNPRPDRTQEERQRLHTVLNQTEQFLTTLAQQYISVEQETASFQGSNADARALSAETTQRLHVMNQVTAALHANLTVARQMVADVTARLRE